MSRTTLQIPDLLPMLSRGKHRNPKRGACFMEYASYLAGEAWSDHPACTDPALASLARMVNDCSSDSARSKLVTLVPSIIGLTGGGTRTGVQLAAVAASAALPIASEGRQRALAAGLMRCQELLRGYEDQRADSALKVVETALVVTPGASVWARQFLATTGALNPRSIPLMSDAIIRTAVVGIADACVDDSDARLFRLLAVAIETCTITSPSIAPASRDRRLQHTH